MRSYTVKENHIGSAVSEILRDGETHRYKSCCFYIRIWFCSGFLTSLGRNFVPSDELILQETPIGDIIKNDVSPIGDIPVDNNPTLSAVVENKIAPLGDIDVSKLSPQIDLFSNDIESLGDVNVNKVSSINDLVDNDIARDNHEVPSSLDHLVSNDISRFSDTSEKNPPNLDDLDNNKIVRLSSSDENKAPTLEDLVTNDISRSDHIDGDINDDLVKDDIYRLDLIDEKIEDSLVDIIEHRIVEPILEYSLSPAIESGENEVTIKNVGGLVMPLTIEWIFTDGSTEIDKLPAEVWRINEYEIKKTFVKTKEASKVNLDPNFEFADVNMQNNSFPKTETPSEFDAFKNKKSEK